MIEGAAAWLARLPSGGRFLALVAVLAVAAALVRAFLVRRPAGRRALAALHASEGGFVALLLAAMLSLSFLQIVLRNLAATGFVWIDPLLRHLLLWIGFAGAALATRLDRHINVDALTRTLPSAARRTTGTLASFAAAGVSAVLADATLQVVRDEAAAGTTGFLDVPTWILQAVMPLACVVMATRFLRHAIAAARGVHHATSALHPEATP